jgi:hypothetical protein
MFRKRDPQTSLFSAPHFLPPMKRERLEKGWVGEFRRSALPLIDEDAFRDFYHDSNGRPNKPVQTVIGALLLKEMNDLTDAETVGALDYDLRWQVALDLEPEETHVCQKTLHNFRAKIMASDRGRLLFEQMTAKIIHALGVSTERQRLDSTHITSNVARLTRLGLFCETARVFLKELRKKAKRKFGTVPDGLRGRYIKDDGADSSYDDARSSDGRRRIAVCARDVWRLVDRFKGDTTVAAFASYGLVKRLLGEQCELVEDPQAVADGDADANEPAAPVAGPKVDEAEAGKITKADFDIDSKGKRKTRCPAGHEAASEKRDPETGKIRVCFDSKTCADCPHAESCPAKPLRDGRRVLRTTIQAVVLSKRRR